MALLVAYRSLLVKCRAPCTDHLRSSETFLVECRALLVECMALLIAYRAFLVKCRAPYTDHQRSADMGEGNLIHLKGYQTISYGIINTTCI